MFTSAIGRDVVAASLQKCSISFSACFSAFIFSPNACNSALPPRVLFQPWQECVFVTLKRALTPFSTTSFSSGDFSVMTCDGKDRGHSQSFLQVSIKDRLAILPPTPFPHFHLLQLLHPTLLLKKSPAHLLPRCFLALLLNERPPFSFLYLVRDLLLYCSFSYWPGRKEKENAIKVNSGNRSTFLNRGDLAVGPHSRVSETLEVFPSSPNPKNHEQGS